jgi:hypothetical protein
MVVKIAHSSKASSILNYNEKKVSEELPRKYPDDPVKHRAELIHANGFLKDKDRLTYHDKSQRFRQQNELNSRSKENMLHISLNFDPSEDFSKEKMQAIADRYMELIGFKDQPYLVYKHNDAGHPHMHIVTNTIDRHGKRKDLHYIAKKHSEPARKTIEQEFDLVRAEGRRKQQEVHKVDALDLQKVQYGPEEMTKKSMTEILLTVKDDYKYTSLPEYNAALRQYNVLADRGSEGSRTYKHGGLNYRAIGEDGKIVGAPIKASDFYFKPTLENLEEKFKENTELRKKDLPVIRAKVDMVMRQGGDSLRDFVTALKKDGIDTVVWQNKDGRVYGLTYVDADTKAVVNGRDLGKAYSASAILKRYPNAPAAEQEQGQGQSQGQGQEQGQGVGQGQGNAGGSSDIPSTNGAAPSPPDPVRQEQSPNSIPLSGSPRVPKILADVLGADEQFGRSPKELDEDQKQRRRILR